MKKFLAFMLAASMLLSVSALAADAVQDEQPPVLVTRVTENNGVVAANIYDAQGNLIGMMMDDGSVELTDVNHRKTVEDEEIKTRLTSAYESVMEDVHHSDVACELHDHDLKVDINMVLSSLDYELNAHDLVMYELFDAKFSKAAEALLVNDSYVELVLELKASQPLPLIVMFSGDGINWSVIPYETAGAQQIIVRLKKSGAIALLCDGRATIGIGEEKVVEEKVPFENEGNDTPSENFTPSVSGKTAPEVIPFTNENGESYVGIISNKNSDEKVLVPNKNYVLVTAVAERAYNVDIQTYEHLVWGYESILEAEDVGGLYTEHDMSLTIPDHEHGTIAGLLDDTLAQMGLDLTHEQLVVKDLFEVTAYGEYVEYLYDEDYYLEVTFDTDLDAGKAVVVIHSADSVHWHVHPIEEATVHADGKITLKMYDLGAVAILVEKAETIPQDAVTSPE